MNPLSIPYDSDLADILGESSPLDRPLNVTEFGNISAKDKREQSFSLRELASELERCAPAASKSALPLLKLASYGDARSDKGSLRHDGNVTAVHGVEVDHDAGSITITEAAARLRKAGIAALVHTTPSYTLDRPRWRILCPASRALEPAERDTLAARLNGLFAGALDQGPTFARSLAFYWGRVEGVPFESQLLDGRAIDLATHLDAGAIGRPQASEAPTAAALDPAEWPRVHRALTALSPDLPYEDWVRVGMALHHASGGLAEGFAAFDAWSARGTKYKAGETRTKWRSFDDSGRPVTVATLFELAYAAGWREVRDVDSMFDEELPEASPAARLRFLTPDECESAPRRGYIVKGLLAPRDVGCIFGAPGAGKSLIGPHLGYAVAQGREAFGMRTKPGEVFYVAAEDPHGMRGRVHALKLRHDNAQGFTLVEGVSDLMAAGSPDFAALKAAVAERKPALIIIDTLAMAFPGLEENQAESMGRVVAVARKLTEHGAAVILIHHDTKAEGATPRGHSILNGALDVALHVRKGEDGVVRASLTKNRNGPCDRDIAFLISSMRIGEDEDGDDVTAALVDELDAVQARPQGERPTPSEAAALSALREMGGTATLDAWKSLCIERRLVSASDKPKIRWQSMDRALKGLARKGLVLVAGDVATDARLDTYTDAFEDTHDDVLTSSTILMRTQ